MNRVMDLPLVTWAVSLLALVAGQNYVCVPPNKPATAPNTPTISNSYQAYLEVKILDQNNSFGMDEYLDTLGKRVALVIHNKAGQLENMIFSFDTDEVFDVSSNLTCQVYNTQNNPYSFLITVDNNKHFSGAAASLQWLTNNTPVYNGSSTVRGIPADVWTACIKWPNSLGAIRATYYFSKPYWNMSSPQQQTPLQVEVEGSIVDSGATNARHFHHLYDFINYLPYIDVNPSIFQTPSQVVCPKRKTTKQLPQLDIHFKYKAEVVDSRDRSLSYYAMWYDKGYKMVRKDVKTVTPTDSGAPIINTTTEIHDFNTGVRYIRDSNSGCYVKPIDPSDTNTDGDVFSLLNGTSVVDMQDPTSFFALNHNYSFSGQRTVRGVLCDIFSANVQEYVYEYAFVADGWNDYPLLAVSQDVQKYPLQLIVSNPAAQYSRVYNFFEFDEDPVTYPAFDISSCFDERQKIGIRLTFPGNYQFNLRELWVAKAYNVVLAALQVFPIRLGGITVSGDDNNIYVHAFVLGSSSIAQFEVLPVALEHFMDMEIKGVKTPDECADLCVDKDSKNFTCEGFQYCQYDGYACRLGKNHVPTNGVLKNATACDVYARAVKTATMKEPTIAEAYQSLLATVELGNLQILMVDNNGNQYLPAFTAADVEIVSGDTVQSRPLPILPSAFSYRVEIVVPSAGTVQENYVWYDQSLSLVRYDNRDLTSPSPYWTTNIHDFNIGVSYQINRVTQQCQVYPISSSGVFDVSTDSVKTAKNGGLIVSMKTPNGLFFLDDTYIYVGQDTVRGILCDVFESKRMDFDLEYFNNTGSNTVFRYFFQADSWYYISPQSTKNTQNQPVQLNIEDRANGAYLTYNFYDFTEQHFSYRTYDASACYSSEEKKSFQIIFKDQPYHPTLDTLSGTFLQVAVDTLARVTFSSPINFQRVSISYDDTNVYLVVTALGRTSLINQFTPVMKVSHNTSVSQINALSLDDCAAACILNNNFICNSFDYCDETDIPNCILGATHAEGEGDSLASNGPCTHFSRTENGSYPGMSVTKMYATITNLVYEDQLQIPLIFSNGTNITYLATDIRDDIRRPTDPDSSPGSLLQRFVIAPTYQLQNYNETISAISVTDCAMSCVKENTFACEAFDYLYTLGTCRLSSIHPDEYNISNPGLIPNQYSSVYARTYTSDYVKYDTEIYVTKADKVIQSLQTDDLCARACSSNTDFVCESFERCVDNSCLLHKTHIFQANPADVTSSHSCVHYSRNHLFDYIRRDNKIIQGYDDSSVTVDDATECAQLCSSGDTVSTCASFELCQIEQGETTCTLSSADPTTQKNLTIISSLLCSLYTRANPGSNGINPTVNGGGTSSPGTPTGAITPGRVTATPGPTGPTLIHGVTRGSVRPRTGTAAINGGSCGGAAQTQTSDTGPQVGIAFGTLILGGTVGALGVFLFFQFYSGANRFLKVAS